MPSPAPRVQQSESEVPAPRETIEAAVAQVAAYSSSVTYPNNGFAQALRMIAGAMVRDVGTNIFWVQTGGYDTHASQNPIAANGAYSTLMGTLNDGLIAFYNDLQNQGLLNDTLVLQYSEFGRRMQGEGEFFETVQRMFEATCQRLGLNQDHLRYPVREGTFRRPTDKNGQLRLF